MNGGISVVIAGMALIIGAGGTYLILHEGKPTAQEHAAIERAAEERAATKADRLPFGPVPHVTVNTLPVPAPPPAPVPEVKAPEAPVVHHVAKRKVVHHRRVKRRHSDRPTNSTLQSKWGQSQSSGFSLERLLNVQR